MDRQGSVMDRQGSVPIRMDPALFTANSSSSFTHTLLENRYLCISYIFDCPNIYKF
jgi:hypothetical protein